MGAGFAALGFVLAFVLIREPDSRAYQRQVQPASERPAGAQRVERRVTSPSSLTPNAKAASIRELDRLQQIPLLIVDEVGYIPFRTRRT